MTNEMLAMIAFYFACADAAAERNLSSAEVIECAAVYREVKLGFVEGIDGQDFEQLSAAERSEVNRAGFLAYRRWRVDNPELVSQLLRAARGTGPLPNEG